MAANKKHTFFIQLYYFVFTQAGDIEQLHNNSRNNGHYSDQLDSSSDDDNIPSEPPPPPPRPFNTFNDPPVNATRHPRPKTANSVRGRTPPSAEYYNNVDNDKEGGGGGTSSVFNSRQSSANSKRANRQEDEPLIMSGGGRDTLNDDYETHVEDVMNREELRSIPPTGQNTENAAGQSTSDETNTGSTEELRELPSNVELRQAGPSTLEMRDRYVV